LKPLLNRRALRRLPTQLLLIAAILLLAGGGVASAQEPTPIPTLVITQPTPFVTPSPGSGNLWLPADNLSSDTNSLLTMHDGAVTDGAQGYVIDAGDTLLTVALEMGQDVEEMGCVIRPDFDPALPLVIGDRLEPLPAGVICHRTGMGETVRDIATLYGVSAASILAEPWNLFADEYAPLPEFRYVRIPHVARQVEVTNDGNATESEDSPFLAWMLTQPTSITPQEALVQGTAQTVIRRAPTTAPVPADWKYGSGVFMWPTYGWLTQGYRSDHRAVDIAAVTGSPVTASDRGVVLRAGWNNQGYGNFVIVDHNIDYLTLYAHLDSIFVKEGEIVAQGQILGTVGSTGNSTGPHLHFEIRDFGRLVNPLEFLGR